MADEKQDDDKQEQKEVGRSNEAVRLSSAAQVATYTRGYAANEFKLPLEPLLTRFVPLNKEDAKPEALSEEQAAYLKEHYSKDALYLKQQRQAKAETSRRLNDFYGKQFNAPPSAAYDWLGLLTDHQMPTAQPRLRTEKERLQERATGKRGPLRANWPHRGDSQLAANEDELLIPIRLELEHDSVKLRDTFTWNMKDTWSKPELFVNHLIADMQLPNTVQQHFRREIMAAVNDALAESRAAAWEANVYSSARSEHIDAEDHIDSGRITKKRKTEFDLSWTLEELAADPNLLPKAHDELRILIKLDITVDALNFADNIEWDLSDPLNSAEDFASAVTIDLGLPGEFATAIAHSIHEQVDAHVRSLGMVEHRPGNPVVHDELRNAFLGPIGPVVVPSTLGPAPTEGSIPAVRPSNQLKNFTPQLDHLSPDQILHSNKEREREARRKRRNTKGRQRITLPDRDPVKTQRTLMPKPGSKEPALYQNKEGEQILEDFEVARPPGLVNGGKRKRCFYWTDAEAALEEALLQAPRYKTVESDESARQRLESLDPQSQIPKKRKAAAPRPKKARSGLPPAFSEQPPSRAPSLDFEPEPTVSTVLSNEGLAAIGQHPNIIDGLWHCTNCGAPDGVAIGRRKGPGGDKTLCAACGKHWQRYKRHRPCEYTTSPERHRLLIAQEEEAERLNAQANKHNRKKSTPAKYQNHQLAASGGSNFSRQETPQSDDTSMRDSSPDDVKPSRSRLQNQPVANAYENPTQNMPPPRPPLPELPQSPSRVASALPPHMTQRSISSSGVARTQSRAPQWIVDASAAMHAKYPEDAFEIIAKQKAPTENGSPGGVDWRVRCIDCPGKLYTPGPEESLINFEVHLKNRNHRANVAKRISGAGNSPAPVI